MLIRLMTVFLFLSMSMAFAGDICEDINDLSNDWNEVANFLGELEENDDFSDRDLRRFEQYVTDLAEDTYILADALIDLGNQRETNLGTTMRKRMAALAEADSLEAAVARMDNLVDSIDRVTDYCDE
ncbi:hypothetical protein [Acanthopleuribacter pedis]|uniref:Uncharacterized protein n=1 Tax=Acanthopleuribacter pedis TaxID=442870 RepID=A0A8J7QNR8_9BACT|nr:hypothetical protein [Acanthopleuribacter pedis]MBO1321818.1 hypothetical protein [Acanthopleuribacter pedis]